MPQSISIPRTAALRGRILTRLKFICGKRVKTGEMYNDAHAVRGWTKPAVYTTRHYDDREKLLLCESIDRKIILVLSGDMAVWRDEIYADDVFSTFYPAEPIDDTIRKYADEHHETNISSQIATAAIKGKYPQIGRMADRIGDIWGQSEGQHIPGGGKCESRSNHEETVSS